LVRYNGKHLNDDSQYKTNIIFQLENKDDTVKNATDALANKHPKNSYIAKMDEEGNIKIYDVDGNEVALNVNGKYRINVVGHGSSMLLSVFCPPVRMTFLPLASTSMSAVLPVTSTLVDPLPLSYNHEYSKLLNELIQKEGKDGSNYNFLRKLEADFQMTKVSSNISTLASTSSSPLLNLSSK
jgi:hypothetical protein